MIVILGVDNLDATHAANAFLVGTMLTIIRSNLMTLGLTNTTIPKLEGGIIRGSRSRFSLRGLAK